MLTLWLDIETITLSYYLNDLNVIFNCYQHKTIALEVVPPRLLACMHATTQTTTTFFFAVLENFINIFHSVLLHNK